MAQQAPKLNVRSELSSKSQLDCDAKLLSMYDSFESFTYDFQSPWQRSATEENQTNRFGIGTETEGKHCSQDPREALNR